MRLALLFGGPSAEHDVSLVSAKNILQALQDTSVEVLPLGLGRNQQWHWLQPEELSQTNFKKPIVIEELGQKITWSQGYVQTPNGSPVAIDLAFPIMHGPFGEDGQLQSFLKDLGIPFVGTDSEGCQLSFDKGLTKSCLQTRAVPQVPHKILNKGETLSWSVVENELGAPVFVKPACMGSSIGISKVKSEDQWQKALDEAFRYDKSLLIEKGLKVREIECALLETDQGLQVSGLGEVVPHHEFYSYEAKYLDEKGADIVIPARVEASVTAKVQSLARLAFQALKCRDFARADFFLTPEGDIYFNEINTHPGFTNISQFPLLWQNEGWTYSQLIQSIIARGQQRSL